MKVETVILTYRNVQDRSRCHRKKVSKVTREDGKTITFGDLMSNREAIRQALRFAPDAPAWK